MQYYNSFNGPSRPSSYSHTVAQHNFGASSMQNYHLARPTWTPAEDALAVWLLSRDFNIPDVSRIMQCRLQRPIHSDIAFMNRLEKINMDQARRHLPPLCTHGLANWDRTVVDDYLFRLTSNSDGLESLLWFHERSYIPLLRTWHDYNIPLRDVLSVPDLREDLAHLIERHRRIYGNHYPHARGHFR